MKQIVKLPEPTDFLDWKRDFPSWNEGREPNYEDLRNPIKKQVQESLIREQGKLCGYCGMRIGLSNSHIEHLKPHHMCTPVESLAYHNIVASCEGENKQIHCGHNKDRWFEETLFVSPLDECYLHA